MSTEVGAGGKVELVSALTVKKLGETFRGSRFFEIYLARAKADKVTLVKCLIDIKRCE